jgi:APA family basic amino acid/polyamine antiporter
MMPWGILGSLTIVTVIYFLMCIVLNLMVPLDKINTDATFAAAFDYVGLPWAKHIVAFGAVLGACRTIAFRGRLVG